MNDNRTTVDLTAGAVAGVPASAFARNVAIVCGFAALTWIGANIVIPVEPVPITMQTLFVLLAGALAGSWRGASSQALYAAAGGLGIPIFAQSMAGWGVIAGPTGGYIVSFAVAPIVVGAMIPHARSVVAQTLVFVSGTLIVFAMGVAHLAVFYTHDLTTALQVGLLPFLPGAVFKIVAAVSIYRSWTAIRNRG